MKLPTTLVLLAAAVALLAGCKGHEPDHVDYADSAIQWGQPHDGLQVGLGRRTYEAGKAPVFDQNYLTMQLRNVNGQPLSMLAPAAISGTVPEPRAGNESVRVRLVYKTADGVKTAEFTTADKPAVQVMEPDKIYKLEMRLSPSKFGLDRFVPGTITAEYVNAQQSIRYNAMGGASVTGLWTGEVKSGAVSMDPAPAPATQQGGGAAK